jgi:MOSC domain-containing protein YiiM
MSEVVISHVFVARGHNFFGHHGRAPGTHAAIPVERVRCWAGRGLEGDRFCDYRPDYAGQVTFFDAAVLTAARRELGVPELAADAFRRNVVVDGLDLPALVGRQFRLQGITFEGTGEARPCYWMNVAVAPRAEEWLRGRGGLRARIRTDGELAVGPVPDFAVRGETAALPF